ncbi:MAG: FHA domain-containing protein [Verrucomicrobia bacterium]|nr:FHA domain-containing protein [Verrucomicrobiota bacterium]MCH8511101.1 FHA domain-containing protein [Kiritimatiellia bacterium]
MTDTPTNTARLHVRYTDPDGKPTEMVLAEKPVTIGRSPDADIITLDERASRMHCGIRIWDGEYYIKDLKSKNGTYLNNQRVEMAKIKPGDKIRLGNTIIHVDDKKAAGTDTTVNSVQDEMNEGKGYKTILREIVENTEKPGPKPMAKAVQKSSASPLKPAAKESDSEATKSDEPRTKTAKLVTPPPEEFNKEDGKASDSKLSESKLTDSKIVRRKPTAIKIKRS